MCTCIWLSSNEGHAADKVAPFDLPKRGEGAEQSFGYDYARGGCWNREGRGQGLNHDYIGECGDLAYKDLQRADLRRADLIGANLYRAHLEGAKLRGANLKHAFLGGAHLHGANLRDVYSLEGARYNAETEMDLSDEEAQKRGMKRE